MTLPKIPNIKVDKFKLKLVALGFLVISLISVSIYVSDPLRQQQITSVLAGAGGKVKTGAQQKVDDARSRFQKYIDSRIRQEERSSQGNCTGAACLPGNIIQAYKNNPNYKGQPIEQAVEGAYQAAIDSAKGTNTQKAAADLNNLKNGTFTINGKKYNIGSQALYNQAVADIKNQQSATAQTEQNNKLKIACVAANGNGGYCNSASGLQDFLQNQQAAAIESIAKNTLLSSNPTDQQLNNYLNKLKKYLAEGVITPTQFNQVSDSVEKYKTSRSTPGVPTPGNPPAPTGKTTTQTIVSLEKQQEGRFITTTTTIIRDSNNNIISTKDVATTSITTSTFDPTQDGLMRNDTIVTYTVNPDGSTGSAVGTPKTTHTIVQTIAQQNAAAAAKAAAEQAINDAALQKTCTDNHGSWSNGGCHIGSAPATVVPPATQTITDQIYSDIAQGNLAQLNDVIATCKSKNFPGCDDPYDNYYNLKQFALQQLQGKPGYQTAQAAVSKSLSDIMDSRGTTTTNTTIDESQRFQPSTSSNNNNNNNPAALQDNSKQYALTVTDTSGQNIFALPDNTIITSGKLTVTAPNGVQTTITIAAGTSITAKDLKTIAATIPNLGGLGRYLPPIEITMVKGLSKAFISSKVNPYDPNSTVDIHINSTGDVTSNITQAIADAVHFGKYDASGDKSVLKVAYDLMFSTGRGGSPGNYFYYNPQQVLGAGKNFDAAISQYLTNPQTLKQNSPAEYAFFDAVYKGYDPLSIQFVTQKNETTLDTTKLNTTAIIQNNQSALKAQQDYVNSITFDEAIKNLPDAASIARFKQQILAAAQDPNNPSINRVPVAIILGIIQIESSGNPNEVTKFDMGNGQQKAVGLMQVVDGPLDPAKNLDRGISLLLDIYNRPDLGNGNWRDTLALYNADGWGALMSGKVGTIKIVNGGFVYADNVLKSAGIDPSRLQIKSPTSASGTGLAENTPTGGSHEVTSNGLSATGTAAAGNEGLLTQISHTFTNPNLNPLQKAANIASFIGNSFSAAATPVVTSNQNAFQKLFSIPSIIVNTVNNTPPVGTSSQGQPSSGFGKILNQEVPNQVGNSAGTAVTNPAPSNSTTNKVVPYKGYVDPSQAPEQFQNVAELAQVFNDVQAQLGIPGMNDLAAKKAFIQAVIEKLKASGNPSFVALANDPNFTKYFAGDRVQGSELFGFYQQNINKHQLLNCNQWAIGVANLYPDLHIVADQYPFQNGGAFSIQHTTSLTPGCNSNMSDALSKCSGQLTFNVGGDVTANRFTDFSGINSGDSFVYGKHFGVILDKYQVSGKYYFLVTEANSPKGNLEGQPQTYIVSQDDFASRVNDLSKTYFLRLTKFNQGTTSPSQPAPGVLQEINNYGSQTIQTSGTGSVPGSSPVVQNASPVGQKMVTFAEQKMQTCGKDSGGLLNVCDGNSSRYWCTNLVIDAAKDAGIQFDPSYFTSKDTNINSVQGMYDIFNTHGTTFTMDDVNAGNIQDKLTPGVVVFINTPTTSKSRPFDHVAIVKDVRSIDTVASDGTKSTKIYVDIIQSDAGSIEQTAVLNNKGQIVYSLGKGKYYFYTFADPSKYAK